jgi:type IV pilus assembly protein PilB
MKLNKKPLGEILVESNIITREQLEEALAEQRRSHVRLGEALLSLGFVTEEQITQARAVQLDVPYINLQEEQPDPAAVATVSESVARAYKLIPFKQTGDKITVAMANPLDVEAIDLVQFETKCRVEPALATEWRIMEWIDKQCGNYSEHLQSFVQEATSNAETSSVQAIDTEEEESEDINEVRKKSHRAPIINLVNLLLTQAVRRKASDIHIEPRKTGVDIRFRIDGDLQLVKTLPRTLHAAVASRIKIMADLDIAERRLPQDGRITIRVDGRNIDLRVSTNPTLYGERIVLRVLDRAFGLIPLQNLGFSPLALKVFERLINQPYGIILVTGPTGSGKTTTLYAALNSIKSERVNIMTVEDPVEYELDGINQTNVHEKIGLTFANQLRTILRQDPDIVLVGEIRDGETADIAFRAALTGHLVLSTLHCNDAPSAITRLIDMGVEPFLVSSAVLGIVAQRLVRVLCNSCKEPYEPDDRTKIMLGLNPDENVTLYRSVGCPECDNTGFKGRTTIAEIMPMTDRISRLALAKAPAKDIRDLAIENGMITMRQDASSKVIAGITTVDEVRRKVFMEADFQSEDLYKTIAAELKAA